MKLTYIYVKHCVPSGLFYLGKTVKDLENQPNCYLGSGKRWKSHLKKHGYDANDVRTYILHKTECAEDLKKMGLYYSQLFSVTSDRRWANLKDEAGDGGATVMGDSHHMKDPDIARKVTNTRLERAMKRGYHITEETRDKQRAAKLGKSGPHLGKKRLNISGDNHPMKKQENRDRMSASKKGKKQQLVTCPICGKIGGLNTMMQRHAHLRNQVSA